MPGFSCTLSKNEKSSIIDMKPSDIFTYIDVQILIEIKGNTIFLWDALCMSGDSFEEENQVSGARNRHHICRAREITNGKRSQGSIFEDDRKESHEVFRSSETAAGGN